MQSTKKRIAPIISSVLLIFILALSIPVPAFATEEAPVSVSTEAELFEAMAAAEDGGIILIKDIITFAGCVDLGSSDKTVTLQRGTDNAFLDFVHDDEGSVSTITNIIFDGNGMRPTNGMGFISANQNMSFENCRFQNNPRSCAVLITDANINIEFTDCVFDDNHNVWGAGGHISIGNAAHVSLNSCRLENGSSDNGGAIGMLSGASCSINNCVITGNTASDLGGGICAVSSSNTVHVVDSQIYFNKARQGADIAAGRDTELNIIDSLASANSEYEDKELTPLGWSADFGILPAGDFWSYINNTDLLLLKMTFEEKPVEPIIITETVTVTEPVYITETVTVREPVYITDTKTKVVEKIVEVPAVEKREPVTLQCGEVILDKTRMVELAGYGNGDLGLEDPVTRAQVAQILYRQMEADINRSNDGPQFPDVVETDWFYEAVMTMAEAGVIAGYDDGCFHPNDSVTWAQLITMLYRFTDCEPTCHIITEHWARDAINTAIEQGWIDYTDRFDPDAPANRGEVQQFINTVLTWAQGE